MRLDAYPICLTFCIQADEHLHLSKKRETFLVLAVEGVERAFSDSDIIKSVLFSVRALRTVGYSQY